MRGKVRAIAITTLVAFITGLMPTYASAATNKNDNAIANVGKQESQSGNKASGLVLNEVKSKREANVKHFMKNDGTYVAMLYKDPVHYFDGKEWQDIDNTLEEKTDSKGLITSNEDLLKDETSFNEDENKDKDTTTKKDDKGTDVKSSNKISSEMKNNGKVFENRANDFKVSIAQNVNADKLVKIEKDKYEISWNIKSDKNVKVSKKELTKEELDKITGIKEIKNDKNATDKQKIEAENIEKSTVQKIASQVNFEDVKQNVDLEYQLISNNLKENIILKKPTGIKNFSFNLNVKNLTPVLKNNQIKMMDNSSGKEVFTIDAPYMIDSKGEKDTNIKLELTKKDKGYMLKLNLDKDWLADSHRVYPVTIDPSLSTSVAQQDIKETFVASNDSSDKSNNMYLRVGNTPTVGVTRSYMKFVNLPKLNSGDMITSAQLYLLKDPSASGTGGQVDVHRVTSDWNAYGLNWANQPSIDRKIEDYQQQNNGDWYTWEISSLVKSWYNNGTNYGLMLGANNEGSGYTAYYSSDISDAYASCRPVVNFYYVNNSGLESYWTYHSQGIGRGGTGYVNDYNGNLTFVHDDLSMGGNRLPVSLNHVFNSNDRWTNIGYGLGWRLNLSQTVTGPKTFADGTYYYHVDEDGTTHYYKYDSAAGLYKNNEGLDTTLKVNSDNSTTITDKKDNKLNFATSGNLSSMQDSNGNTLTIGYSNGRINKVTDGSGRVTTLELDTSGNLTSITDPSGSKTSFIYIGSNLHQITYPDGKYTIYWYDNNSNLNQAVNYDGYRITYSYTSMLPNRVTSILEDNTDGTAGGKLNINYGYNLTTFSDIKGRKNVYQFNDSGNTISVKDDDGGANYYKYMESDKPNKLSVDSKLQKNVINYLKNHNVEANRDWVLSTNSVGASSYTTEASYMGNQSIKIDKTSATSNGSASSNSQTIALQKGKTYTLSGYIKTNTISNTINKGASLFVSYQDANQAWQTVASQFIQGTSDWNRYEVKFTLPQDAYSVNVNIGGRILDESGTAYFDCFQLEDGPIANRYSLVENADFTYVTNNVPDFWINDVKNDSNDTVVKSTDTNYPKGMDQNCFRINGTSTTDKEVHQDIKVNGKAGDAFVLSGWAKGQSVKLVSQRNFALYIGIKYTDGTDKWVKSSFNEDSGEWQFLSDRIMADKDYNKVSVFATYYYNCNTAYFDNIQLYKEEFGNVYSYDSKGNVVSTQDLAKQNSSFVYNGKNELITSTDPKGNQFKYEYDNNNVDAKKHNLTKATSAENVVYSFSYDSNGNPLTTSVGDSTLFMNSSANYTASGNYIKNITNSAGDTYSYNYDEKKDTLDVTTDSNNNNTFRTYDNMDRLTGVYSIKGDTPAESFAMNGTTVGSKGTKSTVDSAGYTTDETGRTVLSAVDGKHVSYNLGINKNSGTIATWFKTGTANITRYIVINDGNNTALLDMYIGSDNKLKLAVRDTATNWKEFITSTDTISTNAWYFGGYSWKLNGSTLQCNLYLNDKVYTGSISNFVDFSGGTTSVGGLANGKDTLSGQLEQFVYSSSALSDDEINQNPDSIYKKGRGNYLTEKSEYFPMNGSSTGSKGTRPVKDTSLYENDENGKLVLSAYNGRQTSYSLGVNKNYGTISTWFNTKTSNTVRYIVINDGNNTSFIDMYIGTDNKLKLAVRDTATNWREFISSTETVSANTWYFGGFSWNVNGSALECSLYLNDKVYSASISNILDFSGATTTVGATSSGGDSLNGQIDQFMYSNKKLTTAEINQGSSSIYGKGRGKYLEATYINNGYTYKNDKISSIKQNNFSYNFEYDSLGNNTKVSVGSQNLITNNYELSTGNLLQATYGNSQVVSNFYDNLDRVVTRKYNGNTRYNYGYDASGNLGYKEDLVNGVNYRYIYDTNNRLGRVQDTLGNNISFNYDDNSNLSKITDIIKGKSYSTSYLYDKDNRATEVDLNGGEKLNSAYDTIGRLKSKTLNTGSISYNTAFTYVPGINGSATTRVASINNNGTAINYTYDKNGNIKTINSDQIIYSYNELNELIREDIKALNKTIVYSYDGGGNITSKAEYPYTTGTVGAAVSTISYEYGDANWKDKLTAYNGKAITYDGIGNPLTYNGYTYTWEQGRQLSGISGNGLTASYKYDDGGIRTQKTVNGVTTNYHLVGDKVSYEDNGTDKIYYSYDAQNNLVSMNLNGVEYYYIRNAQGDIIGLFDKTGTQVVDYSYDTWGKLLATNGSLASTVGAKNPYRYRGYRYDTETGLYYLQSRYYNPEWGRFINADAKGGKIGNVLSHNVFAYCKNNPVNMSDPDGHWALAIGFLGEAICEVAAVAVAVLSSPVVITGVAIAATCLLGYAIYNYYSSSSAPSSGGVSSSTKTGGSGGGGSPNAPNNNGNKKPGGKKKITQQIHHFLTNKSSKYTPQILAIVSKYTLDLDEGWNKELMEHLGRHCNKYHEFMLNSIRAIDEDANGDVQIFLDGFQKIKDYIMENPDKLYRRGW